MGEGQKGCRGEVMKGSIDQSRMNLKPKGLERVPSQGVSKMVSLKAELIFSHNERGGVRYQKIAKKTKIKETNSYL